MTWRKPIPEHARMVFKGEIFEVWQWDQKMYDGTTKVFERLKRPDTVDIIATVDDKIIVLDQEQPDTGTFVSLPGGRSDEGEDPLVSAQRELLEETGCVSSTWVPLFTHNPSGKIEFTVHVFVARDCFVRDEQKLDGGERISRRDLSFEDFLLLSEDSSFHDTAIVAELLRARVSATKRAELHKRIFGR